MIRNRVWLSLAFSLAAATSVAAQAPSKIDVSGKWAFSVQTGAGTGTPTVTLTQKGDMKGTVDLGGASSGTFTAKKQP